MTNDVRKVHTVLSLTLPLAPVYGGDTGDGVCAADTVPQQPVPDLPGEDGGALRLVPG